MVVPRGDDDPTAREELLRPLLDDLAELVVERLAHLVQELPCRGALPVHEHGAVGLEQARATETYVV